MTIGLKRVYEPPAPGDGRRYLVDRLWPRGLSQEAAALTGWLRELSPSDGLRRWYGHAEERFPEFRERYLRELEEHREALERLVKEAKRDPVTLLFAARDAEHSNAGVLKERLEALSRESSTHPHVRERRGIRPRGGPGTRPAASSRPSPGSRRG